jgi:N-glycosylase/DNA lyase
MKRILILCNVALVALVVFLDSENRKAHNDVNRLSEALEEIVLEKEKMQNSLLESLQREIKAEEEKKSLIFRIRVFPERGMQINTSEEKVNKENFWRYYLRGEAT